MTSECSSLSSQLGSKNTETEAEGECLAPTSSNLAAAHQTSSADDDYNKFELSKSPLMNMAFSPSISYGWTRKKLSLEEQKESATHIMNRNSMVGLKRKYSSHDHDCSLPNFTDCLPSEIPDSPLLIKPLPTGGEHLSLANSEFVTPSQPKKQQSRPNSPSNSGSILIPRSRVASIRRESDCNIEKKFGESEAAHEKLVKSTQQVSMGFEDFCLDDKLFEERKRAKSLTEPISIFTNAFLPQSSSPSPSRNGKDNQKQCYSPSAQQVVRSNLAYSPSPSPTPIRSPSVHRMRSMSPIAVRQISKRRYTETNTNGENVSGLESDGEGTTSSFSLSAPAQKRQCTTPKSTPNSSSPLVRESTSNSLLQHLSLSLSSSTSSLAEFFAASSPTYSMVSTTMNSDFEYPLQSAKFLVDPNISQCFPTPYGQAEEPDGDPPVSQLIFNDACSSTTFSSGANTPENSHYTENDASSPSLLLPRPHPPSSCSSSDGSSSRCSAHLLQNKVDGNFTSKVHLGFGLNPPVSPSNIMACEQKHETSKNVNRNKPA